MKINTKEMKKARKGYMAGRDWKIIFSYGGP
jgi:hypothetical protein